MTITTKIDAELPVKIKFDYFIDDDPRFEDITVEAVFLYGVELNQEQTKAFIKDYGQDYLDDLCKDELARMQQNAQDYAA